MSRRLSYPRKNVVAQESFQIEAVAGAVLRSMDWRYSGLYGTSGAGGGNLDTAFGQYGRLQLNVGSRRVIDMEAVDVRHLSAWLQGEYCELQPTLSTVNTSGAIDKRFLAQARLDFQRILPRVDGEHEGMLINATTGEKPVLFGRTLDAARLATNVTDAEGQIDAYHDVSEKAKVSKWFEPDIYQVRMPLASSSDLPMTIKFGDDRAVVGFMVRVLDKSYERAGNPNAGRSDGLVRQFRAEHKRAGGRHVPILDWTRWFDFNQSGTREQGMSTSRSGVGLFTFDDPDTSGVDVRVVRPGDEFEFHFDTAGEVDKFLTETGVTDTVLAAGDEVIVTLITGVPRGFRLA